MNSYNPFDSALTAAAAELTSPAAKRYYVNRAQADIQTVIILIVGLGCMAYILGAQCRAWCDEIELSAIATTPVAPGTLVKVASTAVVAPVVPIQVVAIASVAPLTLPTEPAPIALLSTSAQHLHRHPTSRGSIAIIHPQKPSLDLQDKGLVALPPAIF